MSGAFDFYVDESLLRKLLNDEPESPPPAPAALVNGILSSAAEHNGTANGHGLVNGQGHGSGSSNGYVEPHGASLATEVAAVEPEAAEFVAPIVDEAPSPWGDGDRLFESGEYQQALKAYQSALENCGSDTRQTATLQYNIGITLLRLQSPVEACEAFVAALAQAPDSRDTRIALGYAQLEAGQKDQAQLTFANLLADGSADCPEVLAAALAVDLQLGRFDEAEEKSRRLIELAPPSDPTPVRGLATLLQLALDRQDIPAASEHAARILADGPSELLCNSELLLRFAAIFLSNRDFETAIVCARDGLRYTNSPEDVFEANAMLGEALHALGRSQEALAAFEQAATVHPDDGILLWNIALLYEKEGLPELAIENLRKTIELQPEWAEEALFQLASVCQETGRIEDAVQALERCVQLRPDSPDALYQLGLLEYKLGEAEKAQEHMMQALRLKPDEVAWIRQLEHIAVERDDALLALDCNERLPETDDRPAEADFNLGVVLHKENEVELAAKYYLRAIERRPDFGEALLNLGHALQGLGRDAEARVCFGKAVVLNPALARQYFE
jgi:tetratricopeptide (TPR) repeat protein